MFEAIVALDVAHKIEHLSNKLAVFSRKQFCVATPEELPHDSDDSVEVILVSIYQTLSVDFLKRFSNLRALSVLGTNIKNLPMDYCKERGIAIFNVKEYCDHETAEWVLLQVFKFFRERPQPLSIFGKTLGVVGAGAVGTHLVTLAQHCGMKVFYNDRTHHGDIEAKGVAYLDKKDLFAECDIISVHTPAQLLWLSKDILASAKKDFCLINTCMGRISPGQDLEAFLSERQDVSVIMDAVAAANYPDLHAHKKIHEEAAFATKESGARLIEKFLANLSHIAK